MADKNYPTIEAALGKWHDILITLGVDQKFLTGRHTSCPLCGGIDRFRFDNKDGSGSFYCSQCGPGFGMQFLMRLYGWRFSNAAKEVDKIVGRMKIGSFASQKTEQEKIAAIKKVLKECRRVVHGDPVWTYLNRRTGIQEIPSDIRYHPRLYHSEGERHPAMVSILRDQYGRGSTLHRTYLTFSGEKANVQIVKKFMAGLCLNGSAVRLSLVSDEIGIAEGIETSIAASLQFNIPVWAATNSVLLERWEVPEGVKRIVIFGDNDRNFTGQSASYNLARRLTLKGYDVEVKVYPEMDKDFADACFERVS
jgi:putative DNA primase/helicase